jgi:tetrahydromethanopterin S-methyltransferase subunit G
MIFNPEDADALKHIGVNIGVLVAVMLGLIVAAVVIG